MLPDRVSNPGPLIYEPGALPIALRGPAVTRNVHVDWNALIRNQHKNFLHSCPKWERRKMKTKHKANSNKRKAKRSAVSKQTAERLSYIMYKKSKTKRRLTIKSKPKQKKVKPLPWNGQ